MSSAAAPATLVGARTLGLRRCGTRRARARPRAVHPTRARAPRRTPRRTSPPRRPARPPSSAAATTTHPRQPPHPCPHRAGMYSSGGVITAARVRPRMAAGTETLKRTPLHDRHAAAGARLVPFAGWEMPVQYAGIRTSMSRSARRSACSTSATWARSRRPGRAPRRSSSASSPTTCRRSPRTARSTPCSARTTAGCSTTSSPTASAPTASSRSRTPRTTRRTSRGSSSTPTAMTCRSTTACTTTRCSPSRGRRRARSSGSSPTASCPKRFRTATLTVAGAENVLVAGTGYTGEDGVELLLAPEHATAVWDALTQSGATPVGLGARDTLRLEVCFHLYGNDLSEDRGPIEAGLGWCCKEDTGFIGSEAIREPRARRHRGAARPVRPHRPRHRPPGQPGRRRRRGDERDAVAVPRPGHRHGVPAGG